MTRTGRPLEVLRDLLRSISELVARPEVEEFYIGRSVDVEARRNEHGADETRCVYETESLDHALEVEGALIDNFHSHPKNSNDQDHGGGGTGAGRQHVYVALWFA